MDILFHVSFITDGYKSIHVWIIKIFPIGNKRKIGTSLRDDFHNRGYLKKFNGFSAIQLSNNSYHHSLESEPLRRQNRIPNALSRKHHGNSRNASSTTVNESEPITLFIVIARFALSKIVWTLAGSAASGGSNCFGWRSSDDDSDHFEFRGALRLLRKLRTAISIEESAPGWCDGELCIWQEWSILPHKSLELVKVRPSF